MGSLRLAIHPVVHTHCRPARVYSVAMRTFSLLFTFIALVILAIFLIYVVGVRWIP